MPNIFEYINFRKFLEDTYLSRKATDPGFTHTYICHRLGQEGAKSYFNNVVRGRINVTTTFVDRLINLLELKSEEAKYFRALVNYNQATSAHEREFFFDQIVRLNSTPHRVLDKNAYAFYTEWHHSAIRALLDIINIKNDFKFLASRVFPPIASKQARDSVALLKKLGLISYNTSGFLKPTDKVVSTSDFLKDALVEQFQLKCLEHAQDALVNGTNRRHRNLTMTISISDNAYEKVSSRLQQLKSEVRSIVQKDEEPATNVYHINVNMFPMSK